MLRNALLQACGARVNLHSGQHLSHGKRFVYVPNINVYKILKLRRHPHVLHFSAATQQHLNSLLFQQERENERE
ncbi:hypothetical protein SRHO_G00128840 [Serrasalmus rhombeus]